MKKISVIVTCFNLEEYLDECIDSIKQQIRQPDEIILVHDGCKGTAKAYEGVTTIFVNKNIGVAKARDMAFKISTGDYVVFFDGDDLMPLNYLMMMAYTEADVVYPNCVVWAGWGNSGMENEWHEAPNKIDMKRMLKMNEVLMPCLFKRDWYNMVDGFDETLPIFEDYDFWLKILDKGATFKKSNAFMMYRQRTLSRNHQSDEMKREIYKKITEKFTLNDKKDSKV
jgi:glycosyltransferase involved in cell wall biosynthesis